MIRGGILNSIRYLPQKHIAFVTFVDPQAALSFYKQASKGVTLNGTSLKVGWGQNAHALSHLVIEAVQRGATRNVYLGSIDESFAEDRLRQDFGVFGETELINIIREKGCGFVNFTNILSAVKAVETMRHHPVYANVKVNFGRDRHDHSSSENESGTVQPDDESNTIGRTEDTAGTQEDSASDIGLEKE
ncbi:hypothetical protein BGZ65_011332 [Modicella reniformis]|uniref:RRM domain-containing protein n=1 Tax=Modicella reniformis TaxID=1440133 RepID=A0A9P6LPG3_9FUNG|nr:hypothetical protein BGZ65_011332 [Modicella reniformis]